MEEQRAAEVRTGRFVNAVCMITIICLGAVVFLVSLEVTRKQPSTHIWIEAESAVTLVEPMEISDDPLASGGKCIEIKQGRGTGMLGAGGEAAIEFDITQPGEYTLWARTFWLDGCSNSFFLNVGGKYYHFGEDALFNEWHWIKMDLPGFETAGRQRIYIRNREDGIKIDKLLISRDPTYIPQGTGSEVIYFTFDDGADEGWNPGDGRIWEVVEGSGMKRSRAYRVGRVEQPRGAYSILNAWNGTDFVYRCWARYDGDAGDTRNMRMLFDYNGENDFCCVDITDGTAAVVKRKGGDEETVVSRNDAVPVDNEQYLLEIRRTGGRLLLLCGGNPVVLADDAGFGGGRIGLGSLTGDVLFDNVTFYRKLDIHYLQNCYYDMAKPLDKMADWDPVSGDWYRNIVHGLLTYCVDAEGPVASMSGHDYWNNYSFEVVERADGRSGIGILFYCTDSENGYLFRWGGDGEDLAYAGRKQLLRAAGGKVVVLAEEEGGYERNQWYRMKAEVLDGRIRTYIDDELIFDVFERNLQGGRVGLFVEGAEREYNERPHIYFWPGEFSGGNWSQSFTIQTETDNYNQEIYFCYQDSLNHYRIRRCAVPGPYYTGVLELAEVRAGAARVLDRRRDNLRANKTYGISIVKRGGSITVQFNEPRQRSIGDIRTVEVAGFHIVGPALKGGKIGYCTGLNVCGEFDDMRVRALEGFADDFASGGLMNEFQWNRISGDWNVTATSFSPVSRGYACVTRGDPTWSGYGYDVDITCASNNGTEFGLYAYYHDEDNNYRLEWSADGGTLRLIKRIGGVSSVLAESGWNGRGGGVRMELDRSWIKVLCGGVPVLQSYDAGLSNGRVGLWADREGAVSFERAHVRMNASRIAVPKIDCNVNAEDMYGKWNEGELNWRVVEGDWECYTPVIRPLGGSGRALLFRTESDCYADAAVTLDVTTDAESDADVAIVWSAAEDSGETGYALRFHSGGLELLRGGDVLKATDAYRMETGSVYSLTFERRGGMLAGVVDGECALLCRDPDPLRCGRVGVFTESGRIGFRAFTMTRYPLYYYEFTLAKLAAMDLSDWRVESGTWNILSSVHYSLYGEKAGERDAILRHKESMPENFGLEFRFSPLYLSSNGEFFVLLGDEKGDSTGRLSCNVRYLNYNTDKTFQLLIDVLHDGVTLGSAELEIPRDQDWVAMRIDRTGDRIRLYHDGKEMIDAGLTQYDGEAALAFGIGGDRFVPVFFQDVAVYPLD